MGIGVVPFVSSYNENDRKGYKEVVYKICVVSGLPISITSDSHQSGT